MSNSDRTQINTRIKDLQRKITIYNRVNSKVVNDVISAYKQEIKRLKDCLKQYEVISEIEFNEKFYIQQNSIIIN